MLETINSKFSAYKLREKIAEMLGASPTQYRYLLNTEKMVEKRALRGQHGTNLSLALTCVFCFVMSLSIAFTLLLSLDVFTYALLGITMSMMVVAFWTVPYFDILLSPVNYPVVAHTPVTSRTYFLVKLTQLLTYTVLILGSLNLLPAFCGIWIHARESSQLEFLFPFVYLPIVFMSGFFTIGVMTVFAGYLTKLYTKKGTRNIAQYAQFVFPALFPLLWVLTTRLPREVTAEKLASVLKWLYVLPNGWFAGAVSLAMGQIERHFLILAGLSIVSTLFLVLVPLRSIAKSYSEYLSYLLESGSRQKSELRVKTPLFARMFRNSTMRAGLCLSTAYLCRDRHILRQFFAMIGAILIMGVIFAQDEVLSLKFFYESYVIGLSPGFSVIFCFIGTGFIGGFLLPVRYSEHWRASWMLKLPPLSAPRDLWRGVQATALLYIAVPFTILMSCIATFIWGVFGVFYVLPGFMSLLYYILLYPKPHSGLPLSEEFIQKQMASKSWIPLLCSGLVVIVFVGGLCLAYLLNIWVYFGVYCIMVMGGSVCFIYYFRKK